MILTSALGLLALGTLSTAPAPASPDTVTIREWQVAWEQSRPRDPAVDAAGHVWFVGQRGNYIAVLDPSSGEMRRHDLPERALPHNVVVGPDGSLWYAGNGDAHIGRMDPATGQVTRYEMPDAAARDPHTLVFSPGGMLWFTVQGGNFIGRLDPRTGDVRLAQSTVARSRPYGIVRGEGEEVWAVLFGTNRIVRVDPQTMALREYVLPWEDSRSRRLVRTSDGMIWFADYARGSIGRLDPNTGEAREWAAPGGRESRPYALEVDAQQRLWFVETGPQPNRFVGFDPARGEFFGQAAVPSGGGTVRHMVYDPQTRSIWFGTDANTIGQARLP
jgi:virginiamycin B lyase